MGESYIEVTIASERSLMDHLVGILSQLGFEGFWEDDTLLKCYISSMRWTQELEREISDTVQIVARSSTTPLPKISVRLLKEQNWNEEWEKTIKPIQVTDRIMIAPSWQDPAPLTDGIILIIDPKMSFGTGYHETTRMMIKLLEKYVKEGMNILDVGTGTGILAIAGIKLGAKSAVGIDLDEWAYNNAVENASRNRVSDSIHIVLGELATAPAGPFDLIAANLQKDVIDPLLDEMTRHLASRGILLLSGLLLADRTPMLETLHRAGLSTIDEMTENEWVALAAKRGLELGR